MLLAVFFYVFIAVILIEIIYFALVIYSFHNSSNQSKKSDTAISLLLYTKNNEELLKKQLPVFLKQEHENYEIVLINHASTDGSLEVMEKFQKKNPTIKIIDVKNNETFWASRKYALTLGIKAAKHEQLVMSSIDYEPQSTSWLQYMAGASMQKPIVIGFKKFNQTKRNFFYCFFDFMYIIKNYTFGNMGLHFNGSSANVSYTKTLFFSTNGFVHHMNIPFGETRLFANEVAKKSNTTFCLHPDAEVAYVQKPSFKSWFREQRKNELILRRCKISAQLSNGLLFFCRLTFYLLSSILLIFSAPKIQFVTAIFITGRFLFQYISFGIVAKKLNTLRLIIALPLFELWHLATQFIIFISSLKSKRLHWN